MEGSRPLVSGSTAKDSWGLRIGKTDLKGPTKERMVTDWEGQKLYLQFCNLLQGEKGNMSGKWSEGQLRSTPRCRTKLPRIDPGITAWWAQAPYPHVKDGT